MALISALLAIALVVTLLTAVLGGFQSRNELARYDKHREISREAAQSILEYSRFKLEEDQSWLAEDPLVMEAPKDARGKPIFIIDKISRDESSLGDFVISAQGRVFLPDEVPFELIVTNNFSNDESARGLRPHTGTLEVSTSFKGSRVHLLSNLRNAPFTNSTVAASGDISIRTSSVEFGTLDPHRNQIRSKRNVMLPVVENMKFRPDRNWQRNEKGTVWAFGEILVGPEDDPLPLDEAGAITGARFVPNGRTAYNVPTLKSDQVGADPKVDTIAAMPGGNYVVGRREIFFNDSSGTVHSRNVAVVMVDGVDLYFHQGPLDSSIPGIDYTTVRLKEDSPPLRANPLSEPKLSIGPAEFVLTSDVESPCLVKFPAKKKVVCETDLIIQGTSSKDLPLIDFVNPERDPKPSKGHLQVTEGSLSLACLVKNAGLLMAENDVNLQPADIEVKASVTEDVAIYAGHDVNIDPSLVKPSLDFAASSGRTLSFHGLVYAGNDFNFDTATGLFRPDGTSIDYDRDIEVIGSVVAQGEMKMRGPQGALLTYNPEFLNDVMEKTVRGGSKRLEVISTLEL